MLIDHFKKSMFYTTLTKIFFVAKKVKILIRIFLQKNRNIFYYFFPSGSSKFRKPLIV